MIYILNRKQETVGVANNGSPLSMPYFNDKHVETLENVSTYEFQVPADHESSNLLEVEGHVIIRDLDENLILFTIKSIQDTSENGMKMRSIYCENTAITELLGDVVRPTNYKSVDLDGAARYVLMNSKAWTIQESPFKPSYDVTIEDYMTVLEALKYLCEVFSAEVYFTVELEGTKIVKKNVHFAEERGQVTHIRMDYGYDLGSVSKTEDSSNICTALIAVGKGDDTAERINLTQVASWDDGDIYHDLGTDWVGSESALQQWSKDGQHIFGYFIDDDAETINRLKSQAIKELKNRIVPNVNYACSVVTLERLSGYESKKLRLGDWIIVKDSTYNPPMAIEARVNSLTRSYMNSAADEVDLGNYKTITLTPVASLIKLEQKISQNETLWNQVSYKAEIQSSNGLSFRNSAGATELTARVFVGNTEIDTVSPYVLKYKWFKHDSNGTLVKNWGGSGIDYKSTKQISVASTEVGSQATYSLEIE